MRAAVDHRQAIGRGLWQPLALDGESGRSVGVGGLGLELVAFHEQSHVLAGKAIARTILEDRADEDVLAEDAARGDLSRDGGRDRVDFGRVGLRRDGRSECGDQDGRQREGRDDASGATPVVVIALAHVGLTRWGAWRRQGR